MKKISSENNPFFKLVTKLKTKQQRLQKKMFVVFDRYSIDCAVKKNLVKYFFIPSEKKVSYESLVPTIVLNKELWKKVLTVYRQSPCQKFIVCRFFQNFDFLSLPKKDKKHFLSEKVIFFYEEVQNYYNLGMIFRICLAFGVKVIFLSRQSVDVYHPLVISASRGAIFSVCVFYVDFRELTPYFRTSGYELVATICKKSSSLLRSFPLSKQKKYVIIFGNEGHGLAANKDLTKIKQTVFIPTRKVMHSLNLAVSSAIIAYEFSYFFSKVN